VGIETRTLHRLRDALLESGRRPSVVVTSAYDTLTRAGLLSPEERAAIERLDPLMETMYLMMAADGVVGEVERDAVRGAIRGLTDDLLRSGTVAVMLEGYEERLREAGRDARLLAIAEVLAQEPAEAETAFALAAAVALADDVVADEENELINVLAEWLCLPPQRCEAILDQLAADRAGAPEPPPHR
jgi:tellurite resistance protein